MKKFLGSILLFALLFNSTLLSSHIHFDDEEASNSCEICTINNFLNDDFIPVSADFDTVLNIQTSVKTYISSSLYPKNKSKLKKLRDPPLHII
ncbi:MAG: Unknown protein [uncultured Campylobacterales bacterium]|uniref:Uncharacterized protein n=1 Tax=uncultured Campylobacterales bacterium TaxID=352960 RepID=A0A6S6SRP8_9BACT|nr:MAG: Unknown protein [uncultured Campylobacterales bacterium]